MINFSFKDRESKEYWKKILLGHWGERLILGVLFLICVAAFLHFRAVHVDVLELGAKAPRYIIAQTDFQFLDIDAMNVLKQEKIRDISSIYKISSKEIRQKSAEFEKQLIDDGQWREKSEFLTFEDIHKVLIQFEELMGRCRFTDVRTIQKMKELSQPTQDYFVFSPKEVFQQIFIPAETWGEIKKILSSLGGVHSAALSFVIEHFTSLRWDFKPDFGRQNALRQLIESSVPPIYTQFRAGSRFIDAGEKVTPVHLTMLASMKNALARERNLKDPLKILGSFLLAFLFIGCEVVYFYVKHTDDLKSTRKIALLVTIMVMTLGFAKLTEYYLCNGSTYLVDMVRYPLFVPFASLMISLLLGTRIALFSSGFLVVVLSLSLAINTDHFFIINLLASLVTILCARKMRRRREVFSACFKAWLSCITVILAFNLIEGNFWDKSTLVDLNSTLVFMFATAILTVGVLPIMESLFRLMTNMTLSEYMDPNNELLRRLSLELPGTYQHSLVVGNLAEAAAISIGANGLFCRVSTLYHDIGKLSNPHYFSENQLGGFNIHQLLTPIESAQVIIAHVREGEHLARKHHLPDGIIDIIKEHHGTTLVYCFYAEQLKQMHNDASKVDKDLFRYPGPSPRTRESAIIMMADSVEAASRALEEMSEEKLTEMVDRVVGGKAEDGQFDHCPITFEELVIVKKSFVKTLTVAHHLRVKYPVKEKRSYLDYAVYR